MKKLSYAVLFLLFALPMYANMASPILEGTLGARPFISEYVDVLHEDLRIELDEDFEQASFSVKYYIRASKEGTQIPFLFYASEYLDSFSVKIDGRSVTLQAVPAEIQALQGSKFNSFSYFFDTTASDKQPSVRLEDPMHAGFEVRLSDMLYFESDLSEGKHTVEIRYRASKWTDKSGWIKAHSFRYALSPAKYWKSFGTLSISLDARKFDQALGSNLGAPHRGDLDGQAEWHFDSLPTAVLELDFKPEINATAQQLINIGPWGLACLTGVVLAGLHFFFIVSYRKRHPQKRFSWVAIVGGLLVPLLFLLSWINSYSLIDSYIGEHASGQHGYTFLLLVYYPFIFPIYGLLCWLLDRKVKRR